MNIRLLYIGLMALLLGGRAMAFTYASSSALASGRWVKIQVAENGIYRLTDEDLRAMGFEDPARVSIHGYGGWPLDEDFSLTNYTDDLPTVPVWRGEGYLLFYGKGPIKWEYDPNTRAFVHTNNPYSTAGYYFVTDATEPLEAEVVASESGAATRVTDYDDYLLHEREAYSPSRSGRELFGEDFSSAQPRTITTFSSIPGITSADGKVTMRFISNVTSGVGVATLMIDRSEIMTLSIPSNSDSHTSAIAREATVTWSGEKSESPNVVVSYNSISHSNVYLDYIRLQFQRELRPYRATTFFRSLASIDNAARFIVQEANERTLVFDVTNGDLRQMETVLEGSDLSFTIPAGSLREFALVQTDGTLPTPSVVGEVANQDLHATEAQDMIIISPPSFTTEAERLAEAHRERDGLRVLVVSPEAIYNEFSSGTPDATAYRRFMKMLYDRGETTGDTPRFLLLFGDGIYDNRGLTNDVSGLNLSNMLLTYQSEASLDAASYVTDDYFAFLEDNSGANLATDRMCVGVGRFPVRTATEAGEMVDKVIGYMENAEKGRWKNNLTFVADDGSNADNYTTLHAEQADWLAEYIETNHPEFLTNKVYFDAYKRDNAGTYPDVKSRISSLLRSGQLLINYVGHGNTTAWSDEYVWTQSDIQQSSYTHLPVWVTATCDFTRFDSPNTSAGESVFLNATSGGIALFTTTRVVYSQNNFDLNQALFANLFEKEKGHRRTLGEAMMETKRALTDRNKLNFILIGDPALTMAYPEYEARVTRINGVAVEEGSFEFQALARIEVEGEIRNPEGQLAEDFSGVVYPTVLDSRDSITTLGNNLVGGEPRIFHYMDYPNTIYVGQDSVRNGQFRFSFMVPKDISYSGEQGKLNLYAANSTTGDEAQGSFLDFNVGGTADVNEVDTIGPEIRQLYLNDTTFVDGGVVNVTPYFVARVWDQSGVNVSGSSVGHDITLTIDSLPTRSYNLNNYYTLTPGESQEGIIQFSLPELEPGIHTAEFKVWDILNNSTSFIFTFEVKEGLKPNLIDLFATPNPARESVSFYLRHDRPETELKVTVMVYDLTGRLLWHGERSGSSELFKAYVLTWDLRDNGGRRLRPGIYLYRAAISANGSREATKANKLIVLGQ